MSNLNFFDAIDTEALLASRRFSFKQFVTSLIELTKIELFTNLLHVTIHHENQKIYLFCKQIMGICFSFIYDEKEKIRCIGVMICFSIIDWND